MNRLIENTVFSGFMTACRLATVPTRRSPESVNATTDGVVRPPSAFSSTVASPPSSTATHELVVPRSIPIVFATSFSFYVRLPKNLSERLADLCAVMKYRFWLGRRAVRGGSPDLKPFVVYRPRKAPEVRRLP